MVRAPRYCFFSVGSRPSAGAPVPEDPMNSAILLLLAAQDVKLDIPYGKLERQTVDIHAPKDAKNLPVVFWIQRPLRASVYDR